MHLPGGMRQHFLASSGARPRRDPPPRQCPGRGQGSSRTQRRASQIHPGPSRTPCKQESSVVMAVRDTRVTSPRKGPMVDGPSKES
eukprot:1095469-Pyramimonas_sp.AAC.1